MDTGDQDTGEIILDGAGYGLAGKTILSGLDLRLTEQRIGIVGRNGSGKSTLLRLMAGLIAPTVGRVRVGGLDPAVDRRAMLARVGIVFQNPDHQIIFPTVVEELAFGLRQIGVADPNAQARALLAEQGRAHWADAPVQSLSHGQRHFLCLLSVLAMSPATILLDEPFAGFDLPTQARLSRVLDGLAQRVVTITHDPATLQDHDRVIWIEGGQVAMDGAAAPVLAAFRARMAELGAADADTDLTS